MSREQTFSKVGWARAFNVLAPPAEDASMQIDVDTLVSVLEALPGYAEIDLLFIKGERRDTWHLMARDMPGSGRRFTCLTTGTEWFDIAKIIAGNVPQYIVASKHDEERPSLFVSL